MKRKKTLISVVGLILFVILMTSCSSKGISGGEFTFSEEDFQEAYEEHTGKLMPDMIRIYKDTLSIEFAEKDEVIDFLIVAEELIGDDKINTVVNTIKDKGIEGIVDAESDDLFIITGKSNKYNAKIMIID